jgi:hypothetical protein
VSQYQGCLTISEKLVVAMIAHLARRPYLDEIVCICKAESEVAMRTYHSGAGQARQLVEADSQLSSNHRQAGLEAITR